MVKYYEFEFEIPEPIKHLARNQMDYAKRAQAYFRQSHPHMDLIGFRNGKAVLIRKQHIQREGESS